MIIALITPTTKAIATDIPYLLVAKPSNDFHILQP